MKTTLTILFLFISSIIFGQSTRSKAQDFIIAYEILYQNAEDSMKANKKDVFKWATWFLVRNAYLDSLSKYFDIRLAELRHELKQTMQSIEFKKDIEKLIGVIETLEKPKKKKQ